MKVKKPEKVVWGVRNRFRLCFWKIYTKKSFLSPHVWGGGVKISKIVQMQHSLWPFRVEFGNCKIGIQFRTSILIGGRVTLCSKNSLKFSSSCEHFNRFRIWAIFSLNSVKYVGEIFVEKTFRGEGREVFLQLSETLWCICSAGANLPFNWFGAAWFLLLLFAVFFCLFVTVVRPFPLKIVFMCYWKIFHQNSSRVCRVGLRNSSFNFVLCTRSSAFTPLSFAVFRYCG